MKKSINLILAFNLVIAVQAQDQEGTNMYESIYLTPKLESLSKLNENMAAHNKKYHGEGIHAAFVQTVLTGRRTGDMVWLMGPGPFASLDSRPAEGGHDEDWNSNIISRTDLMQAVWGHSAAVVSRSVDTHIAELRRKLGDHSESSPLIITVRKAGYRIDVK